MDIRSAIADPSRFHAAATADAYPAPCSCSGYRVPRGPDHRPLTVRPSGFPSARGRVRRVRVGGAHCDGRRARRLLHDVHPRGSRAVECSRTPQDALRKLAIAVLFVLSATLLSTRVAGALERPVLLPYPAAAGTSPRFLVGLSAGLVMVPCAGPVLAAVTVLAATGESPGASSRSGSLLDRARSPPARVRRSGARDSPPARSPSHTRPNP